MNLTSPRFGELLRRLLNLRGLRLDMGEQLLPVLSLVDPAAGELLRLRGEDSWMNGTSVTSAVGTGPRVQIALPVTATNRLSIIERVYVTVSAQGSVLLNRTIAPLTGAATSIAQARDTRLEPSAVNTQLRTDALALALLDASFGGVTLPTGLTILDLNIVLRPGTRFDIALSLASSTLGVLVVGREVGIEPTELP